MTIGFAGCFQEPAVESNDPPPPDYGDPVFWQPGDDFRIPEASNEYDVSDQPDVWSKFGNTPDPLVSLMQIVSFRGASGSVSFQKQEKTRASDDLAIGLYNIRPVVPKEEDVEGTRALNMAELMVALSAVLPESAAGLWEQMTEVLIVYRDGSVVAPLVSREILKTNYLSPWVRSIGLLLWALAWSFGLACMYLVWKFGNDPVVKRCQPFFMQMLCAGSIILATAIFTLSWDEGAGFADHQLDTLCMVTPWFFIVGQLMTFSALFTKLRRLDQVLQFRRSMVTIRNVMGPVAQLILVALGILTVWTALDPLAWERELINESPSETYGQCQCEHLWAFAGSLMALIVFAEGLTVFFAWKTLDVPEDFRESNTIITAILAQLQGWLMGVPILAVLGNSSSDATYFGRVLLVWIFSVSSIGIVVAPKLYRAWMDRRHPNQTKKERGSVSSSKGAVRVSGLHNPNQHGILSVAGDHAHSSSYTGNRQWGLVAAKPTSTASTDKSSLTSDDSSVSARNVARASMQSRSSENLTSVAESVEEGNSEPLVHDSTLEVLNHSTRTLKVNNTTSFDGSELTDESSVEVQDRKSRAEEATFDGSELTDGSSIEVQERKSQTEQVSGINAPARSSSVSIATATPKEFDKDKSLFRSTSSTIPTASGEGKQAKSQLSDDFEEEYFERAVKSYLQKFSQRTSYKETYSQELS